MTWNRSTSEILNFPQGKTLEARISRVDEEWLALKEILLAEIPGEELAEEPSSQSCLPCLTEAGKPEDAEAQAASESFQLPPQREKFGVTRTEADAIMDRVGKFDQDTKLMERMEKVERQNRRLTILGSIFCTLMFVSLMVSAYLLRQHYRWDGIALRQIVHGFFASAPSQDVTPPLGAHESSKPLKTPVAAPENVTKPASGETQAATGTTKDQKPLSSTPTTMTAPPNQGASALTATPKAPESPAFEYVGSITSNRYHYPDCKWAQTILPEKVRGFSSVAEAKKAGYFRCPRCQPPQMDKPESPAANQPGPGGS